MEDHKSALSESHGPARLRKPWGIPHTAVWGTPHGSVGIVQVRPTKRIALPSCSLHLLLTPRDARGEKEVQSGNPGSVPV
jgi:hypothetical protein